MLILNRDPLTTLQEDMNRMFNAIFGDLTQTRRVSAAVPPMNVWEDQRNFYIEAELPGTALEDISVTVLDDEVTIKGQRTTHNVDGATCLRCERPSGSFSRTWTLPAAVNVDQVEATLNNGVLLVTLPKVDKALPRKIDVRTSVN